MTRLVTELDRRGIWLIDDCLYRDIAFVPHHGPLFRTGGNVMTIDAISKSFACYGPARRLAAGAEGDHAEAHRHPPGRLHHRADPAQEATKTCLDLRKSGYLAKISALYAERAAAVARPCRWSRASTSRARGCLLPPRRPPRAGRRHPGAGLLAGPEGPGHHRARRGLRPVGRGADAAHVRADTGPHPHRGAAAAGRREGGSPAGVEGREREVGRRGGGGKEGAEGSRMRGGDASQL